jgi:hypothetical protein
MNEIIDKRFSEYSKYAPKRLRDEQQPLSADEQAYVAGTDNPFVNARASGTVDTNFFGAGTCSAATDAIRGRSLDADGRIAMVVSFAAVVALVVIFAKPISQTRIRSSVACNLTDHQRTFQPKNCSHLWAAVRKHAGATGAASATTSATSAATATSAAAAATSAASRRKRRSHRSRALEQNRSVSQFRG